MEHLSEIIYELIEKISIPAQEIPVLEGIIRFLFNRSVDRQTTSYGLLVQYEKEEQYYQFLQELEAAINKFKLEEEYQIRLVAESNLLRNRKELSRYLSGSNTILAVKDCSRTGDIEGLCEIFAATPEVIKIVGADSETIEKRISRNEHLRYRLLCRQIHLGKLEADDISKRFLDRIHRRFKTDQAFDEEIRYYIATIYEGADFQEQDFIDDLILRIERQMTETTGISSYLRGDSTIGIEFVPYSVRVNKRKEEEQKPEKKETPWLPEVRFPMMKSVNDSDMVLPQKREKTAVILLFLSDYRNGMAFEYYRGAYSYTGIQTNDAPVQYLIDEALTNGCTVFEFLCITSDKVANTVVGENKTSLSRFQELAESCMNELVSCGLNVRYQIHQISSDFRYVDGMIQPIASSKDIAKQIFDQVKDILVSIENQDCSAYVDYTGGLRDISFLMIVLLRYLQFTGIKCEKVVYSNFQKSPKSIDDLQYVYDLMEMISGTDAFTSTANAEPLQNFFDNLMQKQEADSETKKFLNAVRSFSKAISICDIKKIDSATRQVVSTITGIEDSNEDDLEISMLKALIPTVKEKLYLDRNMVADGVINYPLLVRWCLDNNLIQQAITLYVEKIPFYYFDHGILSGLIDLNSIEENAASTKQADAVYKNLFDMVFHRLDTGYEEFGQKVTEVTTPLLRENITVSEVRTVFQNPAMTAPFTKEFERIQKLINICFSQNGVISHSAELTQNYVYGDQIKQSRLKDFLNAFKKKDPGVESLYRHYAYYQDLPDYQRLLSKKSGIENTTWNKWLSINALYSETINSISSASVDSLKLIMGYYLAIKLLRNHMNHASEKEESDTEALVKSALSDCLLPDGNRPIVKMDFDSVKALLMNAIAFIADLKPIRFVEDGEAEALEITETGSVESENIEDPQLEKIQGDWSNPELIRKAAKEVIHIFNVKKYPDEKVLMADLISDSEQYGKGLPTKRELGKPLMNCLVNGYPNIFERVENEQNTSQPFLKLRTR